MSPVLRCAERFLEALDNEEQVGYTQRINAAIDNLRAAVKAERRRIERAKNDTKSVRQ